MEFILKEVFKFTSGCECKVKELDFTYYNVGIITTSVLGFIGLYIGVSNHLKFLNFKKQTEKDKKTQNNNTDLLKKLMDEKIKHIYNDISNINITNDKNSEVFVEDIYNVEMEDIDLN